MASISSTEYSRQTVGNQLNSDLHGWGFLSLVLVVGSLFLRPMDLVPQLRDAPIYQFLIIVAIVLSYRAIGDQLQNQFLVVRPVTACMLLLIVAVILSHLLNGFLWGARESAWKTIKSVVLYLLVASIVNTTQRLQSFLGWLLLAITTMSTLALADNFGLLDLAAFAPIEDGVIAVGDTDFALKRIRGSGIFEDPNDLGLAVVVGIALIPYFLFKPNQGWPRYLWLVPFGILLSTLVLTYSRGAFLAFAATVPAWYFYHRGWLSALVGTVFLLPLLLIVFSGRMTDFDSVYEGTGQSRIQIWSESLAAFRQSPWSGIGEGMFSEQFGIVCHNSFLHTYTELGFLGGTIFLCIFLTAIVGLMPDRRLALDERVSSTSASANALDVGLGCEAYRLRGIVFVVLIGYTVGILSISRQFLAPTYLVLGLAVAAHQCSGNSLPKRWCLGYGLALRAMVLGVAFLGLTHLSVQLLIRVK